MGWGALQGGGRGQNGSSIKGCVSPDRPEVVTFMRAWAAVNGRNGRRWGSWRGRGCPWRASEAMIRNWVLVCGQSFRCFCLLVLRNVLPFQWNPSSQLQNSAQCLGLPTKGLLEAKLQDKGGDTNAQKWPSALWGLKCVVTRWQWRETVGWEGPRGPRFSHEIPEPGEQLMVGMATAVPKVKLLVVGCERKEGHLEGDLDVSFQSQRG